MSRMRFFAYESTINFNTFAVKLNTKMTGFLRLLFFLIIIGYLTRLFMRYIFPWILKRFIRKQQEKYNEYYNTQENKKEGDIEIKVTRKEKANSEKNSFGEYVDYEELDSEQEKDKNE